MKKLGLFRAFFAFDSVRALVFLALFEHSSPVDAGVRVPHRLPEVSVLSEGAYHLVTYRLTVLIPCSVQIGLHQCVPLLVVQW